MNKDNDMSEKQYKKMLAIQQDIKRASRAIAEAQRDIRSEWIFPQILNEHDHTTGGVQLKHCLNIDGPDGQTCKRCQTFAPMAVSNQDDGSFICFSCRK